MHYSGTFLTLAYLRVFYSFFVINQRSSEFVGFGACLMLGMGTIHQTA